MLTFILYNILKELLKATGAAFIIIFFCINALATYNFIKTFIKVYAILTSKANFALNIKNLINLCN